MGSNEPTGTLEGAWGMVMTWKDGLLMLWIFCTVVMAFAARHLFGEAIYLVEQMAAFSLVYAPGLVHLLMGQLR